MSDRPVEYRLLVELHRSGYRQGPGSDDDTRRAIELAGLGRSASGPHLRIAEIGCGTGAAALVLAETLTAQITAVDLFPEFLEELTTRAEERGVADRIETIAASMDQLPFGDASFDVIWSEGAIYNIGFSNGLSQWKRFLKPGGILAASEITWLTPTPPDEIRDHWNAEYPEIDTAANKIAVLDERGFDLVGYFYLPERSWLDNYYRPMEERFDAFLRRTDGNADVAAEIVAAERREIALYERYRTSISYGFYIARRRKEA